MLRNKLNRFSDQLGNESDPESETFSDRYNKAAHFFKGELIEESAGSFVRIISDFDEIYLHGNHSLDELDHALLYQNSYYSGSSENKILDRRKLLFFDIETTGLGGSGTVAFLIGVGSVTDNGFQVRQYFLPDFPDEAAMLEAVRSEIDDDTIIVSYNGKSFDMPILIDRLILQRVERNLSFAEHVDLLHAVRRLFKRRVGSCRLSNIEREILGYYRYDDLPGELVPAVYFNWLSTEDTDQLDKVIEHNVNDIVSLYFLMHQIAVLYDDPVGIIRDTDDLLSLSRILEKRREHDRVVQLLEQFEDSLWDEKRHDILLRQALAYKRLGTPDKAKLIWGRMIDEQSPQSYWAGIELAKYFEHHMKQYSAALSMTETARICQPDGHMIQKELEKRRLRLEKKLARSGQSK